MAPPGGVMSLLGRRASAHHTTRVQGASSCRLPCKCACKGPWAQSAPLSQGKCTFDQHRHQHKYLCNCWSRYCQRLRRQQPLRCRLLPPQNQCSFKWYSRRAILRPQCIVAAQSDDQGILGRHQIPIDLTNCSFCLLAFLKYLNF